MYWLKEGLDIRAYVVMFLSAVKDLTLLQCDHVCPRTTHNILLNGWSSSSHWKIMLHCLKLTGNRFNMYGTWSWPLGDTICVAREADCQAIQYVWHVKLTAKRFNMSDAWSWPLSDSVARLTVKRIKVQLCHISPWPQGDSSHAVFKYGKIP